MYFFYIEQDLYRLSIISSASNSMDFPSKDPMDEYQLAGDWGISSA